MVLNFFRRYFDRLKYHQTLEILYLLDDEMASQLTKIKFEKKYNKNISVAFDGMGKFGELLATIIFPESIGSASKGGCAFDNHCCITGNKREIKTCCLIQPKVCRTCTVLNKNILNDILICKSCKVINKCNSCINKTLNKCHKCKLEKCKSCSEKIINPVKVPFFQEKCIFCNGNSDDNFSYVKDTRFCIDVISHFEYKDILKEYLFNTIDLQDNRVLIKSYLVFSDNEYFTKLLQNQKEKGGKACNLIPYSHDFYASKPVKLLDYSFDLNTNESSIWFGYGNPEKYPMKLYNKKSFVDIPSNLLELDYVEYDMIKEYFVHKKKNFGKQRGKTTRIS